LTTNSEDDKVKTMYRGERARIFPVILVLIVIAIAIAALVSVGRAIFGGGDQPAAPTDTSQQSLINTGDGNSVRMTVRGKIVADETFRSYQLTVSPSSRTLTTYSGYLAQPLESVQLGNNVKAYEEFVYALDKANLAKGTAFTDDQDDTRGICAAGEIHEFEILNGTKVVKRLWASTCKGSPGSLKANDAQVESLFLQQIPDYKKVLSKIDL
jgi:FlaG/FlaF family flagellin (archaellin)